jgi:hypothetical protein
LTGLPPVVIHLYNKVKERAKMRKKLSLGEKQLNTLIEAIDLSIGFLEGRDGDDLKEYKRYEKLREQIMNQLYNDAK